MTYLPQHTPEYRFRLTYLTTGGQKEGSWMGEGGGKVTDIAENQYGDVSS
jgi:hypothetical protein